jgi:nucleotide-binding universal stress UspA family protein
LVTSLAADSAAFEVIMTSSILVAVDGSNNARRAVDYAAAQAKVAASEVHLLNVQATPENYGMVAAYRSELRKLAGERSRAILDAARKQLKRADVPHAVHTVYGNIAPAIVRTARRLKCGSIVMGTRGLGPVSTLVLGSVARAVVHLSSVPVTLVK